MAAISDDPTTDLPSFMRRFLPRLGEPVEPASCQAGAKIPLQAGNFLDENHGRISAIAAKSDT
ncbi:MAG: hypothetical protein JO139_00470 [Alphaproteobacteria bacterium]|nr:hypothetical protein [Alphaproteobacteria bacterium]MBV8335861.1 hypothetical protein [Alphaproteobacteria bacterium]